MVNQNLKLLKRDGEFASLSSGRVHYKVEGEGKTLLMVHGATVGLWEFEPLLPYLHEQGFRTVRFDLYGHGISDRPKRRLTTALFVQQLRELLDYLSLPSATSCLGHSMGAAILASAISGNVLGPTHVALIAPLLCHEQRIRWRHLLNAPVVGPFMMQLLGRLVLSPRRRYRLRAAGCHELVSHYEQQLGKNGYWRSLRALIRDGALADQSVHYSGLNRNPIPEFLLLWGELDPVVSAADIAGIRALMPDHDYRQMPGMAHNLLLTHPDAVCRELAGFLGTRESSDTVI